ncbi:scabin-related ADP-ribosyltransferase [Kitasatospora terrestris]
MLQAALRVLAAASLASAVASATAVPAAAAAPAAPAVPAVRAAADDDLTTPCGPVVDYRAWDWWRTTTQPQIAQTVAASAANERWQWRNDVNTLWRGDTRENVEDIFRAGFTPRGEAVTPLAEYIVQGGGQNSAHLSTSCAMWVAQKFATYGAAKTGWVYEIYAPGGIDVNATARLNGYQSPYLWNKEIDFPGGVEGRYIKGACKYHLTGTDPDTKVSTFENLGCKNNADFAPYRSEAAVAH